ncbi:MAG: hypothetical protein QNJ51_06010 [Calothrix sp. MO_167.B12]|nr:hypothetical protein [Calothrix sp. MO_167.B12]
MATMVIMSYKFAHTVFLTRTTQSNCRRRGLSRQSKIQNPKLND